MGARSRENIAALRAAAETAAVDMDQCILVAGAQTGPLVASRIGMPCVVVRSRFVAPALVFSTKLSAGVYDIFEFFVFGCGCSEGNCVCCFSHWRRKSCGIVEFCTCFSQAEGED